MQHRTTPRAAGCALVTPLLGFALAGTAETQHSRTVLIGLFVGQNYSVQPGAQVSCSSRRLLSGGPRFSAAHSTTRLATALASNALEEDRIQVGVGWHVRRDRTVSPHSTAMAGYTRFAGDDAAVFALLDHDAPLASLLIGAEAKLLPALRVGGSVGYSPVRLPSFPLSSPRLARTMCSTGVAADEPELLAVRIGDGDAATGGLW
jgi:hypothetical protein